MPEEAVESERVALPVEADNGSHLRVSDWPPLFTLFTAPFAPATTARRTQRTSLPRAFAIHVLSMLLILMSVVLIGTLEDSPHWTFAELRHGLRELSDRLVVQVMSHPEVVLSVSAGFVLGVEGFTLLAALMVMPWDARVEKLRTSFAHALRRTWLAAPHLLWMTLLVGAFVILPVGRVEHRYHTVYPYPSYSMSPTTTQMTAEQQQEAFSKASEQYSKAMAAYTEHQPWILRYQTEVIWVACFAAGVWFIWALLRAAAAPRDGEQIPQPPSCEFCGYNLTSMGLGALCPECGRPVVDSLGEDVRVGTPWERRASFGYLRGYSSCFLQGVAHPSEIGHRVRLLTPRPDHRAFLVLNLVGIGLISWVAFELSLLGNGEQIRRGEWEGGAAMSTVAGCFSLGLTLLTSAIVGVILSLRERRNVLPAAVQASSYLSGMMLLSVGFGWVIGFYLSTGPRFIRELSRQFQTDWHFMVVFVWLALGLLWIAFYGLWTWRATFPARFANR